MRWHRIAAAAVAATSAGAVAPATPAAADQPVAVCPPGKASVSVAHAARRTFALGPFSVVIGRAGLGVQAADRVLWSSIPRVPFVGAGKGTVQFTDGGRVLSGAG